MCLQLMLYAAVETSHDMETKIVPMRRTSVQRLVPRISLSREASSAGVR